MTELYFAVPVAIYALRTVLFLAGSARQRKITRRHDHDTSLPFVSVIIPARNEEQNIEKCLRAIGSSAYPDGRFEVIVLNDRSSDRTSEITRSISADFPNIRLFDLTDENKEGMEGKPGALHYGIRQAKGEIILMTDADCEVDRNWIGTVVANFDEKSSFVASFTLVDARSPFHFIQAVEWLFLNTLSSGGIGLNQPLGCFGNNLSVRKSDYFALGGYPAIKFSVTEDLALMQAFFFAGKNIKFICNEHSTITTRPISRFRDYLVQHKRWILGGKALGYRAVFFILASLAMWGGMICGAIAGDLTPLFALPLIRIALDSLVLAPTLLRLKQYKLFPWLPPAFAFLMLLELFSPVFLFGKKIVWKGQNFRAG